MSPRDPAAVIYFVSLIVQGRQIHAVYRAKLCMPLELFCSLSQYSNKHISWGGGFNVMEQTQSCIFVKCIYIYTLLLTTAVEAVTFRSYTIGK